MSAAAFTRLDRHKKDRPAEPGDGIQPGTCLRCGFRGQHATAGECIDALRDRIAVLEFRVKGFGRTGPLRKGE